MARRAAEAASSAARAMLPGVRGHQSAEFKRASRKLDYSIALTYHFDYSIALTYHLVAGYPNSPD